MNFLSSFKKILESFITKKLYLQISDEKDISRYEMFDEIMIYHNIIQKSTTPIQIFNTINKCGQASKQQ